MRPILQNYPIIANLCQGLADSLTTLVAAIKTGWGKQHNGDGEHTDVTATSLTVTPGTTALGKLNLRSVDFVETITMGGTIANLSVPGLGAVSCLRIRQTGPGPFQVTGIDATGRNQGDLLLVLNCDSTVSTPGDVDLQRENAASLAANRIAETTASTGGVGGFLRLQGATGVWLMYDFQTTGTSGTRLPRWRIIDQA